MVYTERYGHIIHFRKRKINEKYLVKEWHNITVHGEMGVHIDETWKVNFAGKVIGNTDGLLSFIAKGKGYKNIYILLHL